MLSVSLRLIVRITLVCNSYLPWSRDGKEVLRIYGKEYGGEVPGGPVLYLGQIDLVGIHDGMMGSPTEVILDTASGILDLQSQFEGTSVSCSRSSQETYSRVLV